MTTTANAIHQPRNFVPSDYDCIGGMDTQRDYPVGIAQARDEQVMYDLMQQSPTSRFMERGQCDHCGARVRYIAVLRHQPTGEHIAVGETCLSNRVGNFSQAEFQFRFIRDAASNARAHQARLDARAAFVAEHPEVSGLVDYSGSNDFFASLAANLLKWGNLSDRQVAAYVKAVARDAERAAAVADAPPMIPAPEGKVTVTGEVVSLKWQESDFGSTLKMLVVDDSQFKVWVTVPSSISSEVEKGSRVTFTATLEQSDRDETFAFGKRPTRAQVL